MTNLLKLTILLISLLVVIPNSVKANYIEPESMFNRADIKKNELIITFTSKQSDSSAALFFNKNNITNYTELIDGEIYEVIVPIMIDPVKLSKQLENYDNVKLVEPNVIHKALAFPTDPGFQYQYHLSKINARDAWAKTKGSSSVVVAVIDGGIESKHPDLATAIYKPYNAVNGSNLLSVDDHGTHVAGIIGATANGVGTVGVAPGVKVMPIDVFSGEYAETTSIIKGINYAINNGAKIINLSLGGDSYSSTFQTAINSAVSKGIIVLAAAGNDNSSYMGYPANYENVLTVSASTNADTRASFSNYGKQVDFSAPGVGVYSTLTNGYNYYGTMSGTSMSTPVVSGVVALMLSRDPFLSVAKVNELLRKSSVDLGAAGWDQYYGYGRVDAKRAIDLVAEPLTMPAIPTVFTATGYSKQGIQFKNSYNSLITSKVYTSTGTLVKTIVSGKSYAPSTSTLYWNGTNNSGTYVATGTYTIKTTMTVYGKSVTKSIKLSIKNAVVPVITPSKTTEYYSKRSTASLASTYNLNKPMIVSARVINSSGATVKTLFSNYVLPAGNNVIKWNATNSLNRKVADGYYRIVLVGKDKQNRIAKTKYINVYLDSIVPTLYSHKISTHNFIVNNINILKGSFYISERAYVTINVVNSNKAVVKTIYNNKLMSKGLVSYSWNGLYNTGYDILNGNYYISVSIRDYAKNSMSSLSKAVVVTEDRPPLVQLMKSTFDLTDINTPISINYNLTKNANVTASVIKNGVKVKTLISNKSEVSGMHSITWDAKDDNGNYVLSGSYQIVFETNDDRNRTTTTTGIINVKIEDLSISAPSAVQLDSNSNSSVSELYFGITGQLKSVTVDVLTETGVKINTLTNVEQKNGFYYVNWNGTNSSNLKVTNGLSSFKFKINAISTPGNVTTKTVIIKNEAMPAETFKFSHTIYSDSFNNYNELRVYMISTDIINFNITLFDYYSSEILDQKNYGRISGYNEIIYTVPNHISSGLKVYEYEIVDSFGNKYYYQLLSYL